MVGRMALNRKKGRSHRTGERISPKGENWRRLRKIELKTGKKRIGRGTEECFRKARGPSFLSERETKRLGGGLFVEPLSKEIPVVTRKDPSVREPIRRRPAAAVAITIGGWGKVGHCRRGVKWATNAEKEGKDSMDPTARRTVSLPIPVADKRKTSGERGKRRPAKEGEY